MFPLKYNIHCPLSFTSRLSLGYNGEQSGRGASSGTDGWRWGGHGQVVRGMWRSNCRPLPALLHGAVLAHTVPQVFLLPCSVGRVQQHLLQQRRHDSLQERLHQVSQAVMESVSHYHCFYCFFVLFLLFFPTNRPKHKSLLNCQKKRRKAANCYATIFGNSYYKQSTSIVILESELFWIKILRIPTQDMHFNIWLSWKPTTGIMLGLLMLLMFGNSYWYFTEGEDAFQYTQTTSLLKDK